MKIKSKYRVARRLGANVFEKTQGPKFALSEQKRQRKFRRQGSDYGKQLLEKQRVRFTYNLSEKQFRAYVKEASAQKNIAPVDSLYHQLESRLDNVVYRLGFAPTRQAARQMVVHGHITVNGKKMSRPSFSVTQGAEIGIKDSSLKKNMFTNIADTAGMSLPAWLTYDAKKHTATVVGEPKFVPADNFFNLDTVIQFYNR